MSTSFTFFDAGLIGTLLGTRQGAEAALSAPEICRRLGWPLKSERRVRRIIEEHAAKWPFVLCATPGQGYFAAATYEEAEAYDNWLSRLVSAASLKRAAFRRACASRGLRVPPPKEERKAA